MGKPFKQHHEEKNTSQHSIVKCNGASSAEAMQASLDNEHISFVKTSIVNDNSDVAVEETPLLNGKSKIEQRAKNVPKVNKNWSETTLMVIQDSVNGNQKTAVPEEFSTELDKDLSNGNSFSSKNGDVQKNSDEKAFTLGKSRKGHMKNRKKQISNVPATQKVDKNHRDVIPSPLHIEQKTSVKSAPTIKSYKSYSSALMNGQDKTSYIKNASEVSSDVVKSKNCDLTGTYASPKNLPVGPAESDNTYNILPVSCKEKKLLKNVPMIDFAGQTDFCLSEMSLSKKKLLSEDEVQESPISSPIDYVDDDDAKETADGSPNVTYCDSVVSNDSGRGDSEGSCDKETLYCQFPKSKTPLLIGKNGRYKNEVEERSGVRLIVRNILGVDYTVVEFKGTITQIERAKDIIGRRFNLNLALTSNEFDLHLSSYMPNLPTSIQLPVVPTFIFNPDLFWVQQHGHPTLYQLEDLEKMMSFHFNTTLDVPIINSLQIGNIVAAACLLDTNEKKWMRGCIREVHPEEGTVIVRYLDHGGDYVTPISDIRPMRLEYFTLQFWAIPCSLYGIRPMGDVWSKAAIREFARLSFGRHPPAITIIQKVENHYYVTMNAFDHEVNAEVDVASVLMQKQLALPEVQ